jgi:hypothetical protein
MSERSRRAVAWTSVLLAVSWASPAIGQPKPPPVAAQAPADAGDDAEAKEKAAAQQTFDSAQRLYDERKFDQALDLFRKAYAVSKSPNANIMIGNCLLALGRSAEAYDTMAATMREAARRAETEAKYAATRDSAAQQLAVLEPRVGKVVVVLTEPGASASVTLNGAPLASDRLGHPMAVEPGNVVVEATPSGGGRSVRYEVAVGAGEAKTVAIVFKGPEKGAVGPAASPEDKDASRGGGVRTAGFAVAGVGVAGMVVFGVAGMMVRGKLATLEEECGGVRCSDPKYGDVIDSGKTLALVTNIGLGVGVAGLAAGGLMIALGGPKQAPSGARSAAGLSASAAVGFSPAGPSIRLSGTF